jgi:hypothetical protein
MHRTRLTHLKRDLFRMQGYDGVGGGEVMHPETHFHRNWVSGFLCGVRSFYFSKLEPKPSFPVQFCTFFFENCTDFSVTLFIAITWRVPKARNMCINLMFLHCAAA